MIDMEKAQCSHCQFYEPVGPEEGACHRHAPTSKILPVLSKEADECWTPIWPNVTHADWCGEWIYSESASKRAKINEKNMGWGK